SGVISYAIKAKDNNTGEATVSITINIDSTSPSLYNTGNTETLNPGTNLRLKSMSKMLGTESDNSTVVNNNNYFTFGDVVSEAGSGLLYTAFYFERDGSTEKRVYNPMFKNSNNTVIDSNSFENGKVYINSDGLASLCISNAMRPSEDSITLSSENKSIRKGGLIKIAGGYSLITEVSGTTVKFSPTASTTFTQAELILAQVVDHKITESVDSLDGKTVVNDDGDGMIETINQIGSSYNWTASVDSNNIPDGPITVHVVAIDNAGNTTHGSIATKVENNRPRIAKVLLGTDLNDNGKYDWDASSAPVTTGVSANDTQDGNAFGEFSYFTALNSTSGKAQPEVKLNSGEFKVINGLCIIPEFVGGNNGLGYILENPANLSNAKYQTGSVSSMTSKADIISKVNKKGTYAIDSEISKFGGIELTSLTSGNISITFWDETEETTQGTDSQWALLKIPVNPMSSESEKPVPFINRFYWNNSTDNSVYIDGGIKGHIELEGDLTDAIKTSLGNDPKVSGKIKIEGKVTDNVRISSVKMSFASLFAEQQLASYTKGVWNVSQSLPSGVESFTIEDVYISQEGHEAKYTLVVDTEKLTGVTGKDKNITISAVDWIGAANTSDVVSYTVDVVPYVTGIGTDLSPFSRGASSVYARTSTGRYPLHENEDITFYGFNLGSEPSVSLNGTVLSSGTSKIELSDVLVGANTVIRSIGENTTSGEFIVTVNSISAINNKNNNTVEYNQMPNGVNNNILTDDLYADVWQFKNAAEPVNGGAQYVTMKINPKTGIPGFSFANSILYFNMPAYNSSSRNYDNAEWYYGADNKIEGDQYSQIPVGMNYGGFSHNTFAYDNYGYSYGAAMCTDTQNAKASAFFQFFSREAPLDSSVMDQNINYVNSMNASRLDSSTVQISSGDYGWVTDIDRIQSIAMETTHNSTSAPSATEPTYIYMAYYDKSAKQVRFRWGTVGTTTDSIDGQTNMNITSKTNAYEQPKNFANRNGYGLDDIVGSEYTGYAQTAKNNGVFRPSGVSDSYIKYSNNENAGIPIQVVAASGISGAFDAYKNATTYSAGQYVSLAIVGKDTANPVAVVAWYDSKNMQLCMAYNTSPTTSNTWTSKVVDANGGINVKIQADADNGIHFAYYDNKGGSDLKYAYMSSYTAEPQIVTVDSYGSVGAKCTIDLAKNSNGKWIPYIGYQMNAYLGTPLAAKIAYLPNGVDGIVPAGVDNKDCYTGDWEISIIPTNNIPNDDLINVGIWRDSTGKAKNFTSNSDWTQGDIAPGSIVSNDVLNVGNATIVHGNNTANPIIGYGIDTGAIEMAQKK
ncbi:MAG: hypothetical protein SOZ24_02980, partial [Treponema sp.]|nr:hypothetical protein [Treponema sp.]